jgi:hypothetical protein
MSHYPPPPQYPPPYPPQYPAPPYGQTYGHIPYAQPHLSRRPAVVTWYYVYCAGMALLYAAVATMFVLLLSWGNVSGTEDEIPFIAMAVVCVPLLLVYASAPLLPRRPWVWIYHLVLICIGLSGITFVASLPLLIYWLKPEAKAWFGRRA